MAALSATVVYCRVYTGMVSSGAATVTVCPPLVTLPVNTSAQSAPLGKYSVPVHSKHSTHSTEREKCSREVFTIEHIYTSGQN